ncbi:hypothetical protein DH2020_026964 [Rehmannia glutinosa]|uniref:Nuclease n=1 Tax=Rehmannia glutinosa TaxID=99300 RepID=A0ABR0VYE1_REHGL
MDFSTDSDEVLLTLQEIVSESVTFLTMLFEYFRHHKSGKAGYLHRAYKQYNMISRIPKQVNHMRDLIQVSDTDCLNNLRMSRNTFGRLCYLLQNAGGLVSNRNVGVSEQVSMFKWVLAHHKKNRIVGFDYKRSGRTVSKHFNAVLNAVIKLHSLLLVDPKPITEDCTNDRWKWFKGCLGALDGTHIDVKVRVSDKGHYRNRNGDISVNVLGVCDWDMKFIYVFCGWEGSAADCRVLRDAITKPNGLRVPRGNFYLCDNGYTNGDGFLTPYRGVRYHLKDWGGGNSIPRNKEEFFNMKHAKARNVIERTFGMLKERWAILRSTSFYPIKVQNRIIMACCLVHNFIRNEMPEDPLELLIPDIMDNQADDADYIDTVEPSQQWTTWRENLAIAMYNQWTG